MKHEELKKVLVGVSLSALIAASGAVLPSKALGKSS